MKTRWIFAVLVLSVLGIVLSRLTELRKLAETLAGGSWPWVLGAGLIQVLYYFLYTAIYQAAFYTVDVTSRIRDLLPITFASLFVNVAAPSGGASGAALFVDDAARRGEPAARAAIGALLVLVSDLSAFLVILIFGLAYLFTHHDLKTYEILGAITLLAIIAGLTAILLLGLWRPTAVQRLLQTIQRAVNWVAVKARRPAWLDEGWAFKNAAELGMAAQAIAAHPKRLARTVLTALLAHFLDLASLYCLFLAFHQPVGPGTLVAAYAMGILFWIVSITPQGIGVVEGVMTLVLTSLGVPSERAAVISLAFRGLTFWLPVAIGFFLVNRVKTFSSSVSWRSDTWSVRLVAVLTALMGVVNILSAVTPSLAGRVQILARFSPLEIRTSGHLAAAMAGFFLLLLAAQLWRRKRAAWLLTVWVLVISAASHLFKGLDYEEAALALLLAGWLLTLRRYFHARSDLPSIRQGLITLLAALLFALFYGAAGFYLLDHHFLVNYSLLAALRQTVVMFTQFYDPGLQPITGFGRYFAASIYLVGGAASGFALLMLARPVLAHRQPGAGERARAAAIVAKHGRTSLARLTLLNDKLYFFSSGGSLLAYALQGYFALSLGDPIGPPEDLRDCLAEFEAFCGENDWRPIYYQATPETLGVYHSLGYRSLCVGQEAIVHLSSFSLSGGENKAFRTSVNHMVKLGYSTELVEPPLPAELLEELRHVSNAWLTHMHGREKHFSLGWFEDEYIRSTAVMVVRSPQGRVTAFANLLPEYQLNEATLDMMRYLPDGEKGQMDYLFVALLQWAKECGYDTFDLGLSALSGIGQSPGDPAIERGLHYIYQHINQFYNFKGLHEFKEKFHPVWSPRYLIYPGAADLPAVALALLRVDSGSGKLPASSSPG